MKIVSIVGTRPNFIKLAALVHEFKQHKDIEHILLHTGQHYDAKMSQLFFEELDIPKPDEHLSINPDQKMEEIKYEMQNSIKKSLQTIKPDLVIVVGDVNSTVAGAKAAHELGIKVAHVEAGLRSFDNTMPEEVNRIETDKISDFLFTTEPSGDKNLENEGITKDKIFFVGNVMIDTLSKHKERASESKILRKLNIKKNKYSVLTLHRPSNVDTKEGLENIISILEEIGKEIDIVFPVHPRTRKNIEAFNFEERINKIKKLKLLDPACYLDFLCLMGNSRFLLTDSGGIQEEATILKVPCITLRKNTERPVTVEQGTNILVSINKDEVINKAMDIIKGKINISDKTPELWDGNAANRIVEILFENFEMPD